MEKKEYYRGNLPHFQQPGQSYFVTWVLHDAIPIGSMAKLSLKLSEINEKIKKLIKQEISDPEIPKLESIYKATRRKYILKTEEILHSKKDCSVDLSKPTNIEIIREALTHWENIRLKNYCFCIMPNHVHWVFDVFKTNEKDLLVYLQDIMHSVKLYSARRINELEGRKGTLWLDESFDITIRDRRHLYNSIEYTLNNPVKAGLVEKREDWRGNFDFSR
ncbi:MAG TPA: hypothetical protein GXZ87_04425 [Bacteroidales bacterium]|nr:hypothetical protein [Bacteroidales bacterium]